MACAFEWGIAWIPSLLVGTRDQKEPSLFHARKEACFGGKGKKRLFALVGGWSEAMKEVHGGLARFIRRRFRVPDPKGCGPGRSLLGPSAGNNTPTHHHIAACRGKDELVPDSPLNVEHFGCEGNIGRDVMEVQESLLSRNSVVLAREPFSLLMEAYHDYVEVKTCLYPNAEEKGMRTRTRTDRGRQSALFESGWDAGGERKWVPEAEDECFRVTLGKHEVHRGGNTLNTARNYFLYVM
ncbi:uncharacterized protein EV420DRAFT_1489344 [Desarmillaria tabescens]|uniref:Uncharacterized protein n=1 Tax=Armillaria tabescens TaxID=1929756 RepID=A0AA39J2G8_ARMTA|nr:uncharacterized protein EV420DRAFT_1489344 [Desarmillaria tabescens]KAK0433228.1 hypothetical protein EV420DRAFT_1489344 [Desarmillaria tabescens]